MQSSSAEKLSSASLIFYKFCLQILGIAIDREQLTICGYHNRQGNGLQIVGIQIAYREHIHKMAANSEDLVMQAMHIDGMPRIMIILSYLMIIFKKKDIPSQRKGYPKPTQRAIR